ncbi:hypothetical protein B0A53_06543 [Rhodotorula sp. CCFEE 5036]|nr:hypothetical protein B0A53_06543 [Rhodotorula sp. CCFEE 5036]
MQVNATSEELAMGVKRFRLQNKHPARKSGVVLRDSHGVAQVKSVTGNKILRILNTAGLAPQIPEDLYCVPRVLPLNLP